MQNYKEQAKELKKLHLQLQQEGNIELSTKVYMAAMSILELDALLESTRERLLEVLSGEE